MGYKSEAPYTWASLAASPHRGRLFDRVDARNARAHSRPGGGPCWLGMVALATRRALKTADAVAQTVRLALIWPKARPNGAGKARCGLLAARFRLSCPAFFGCKPLRTLGNQK